MKILAIDTTAEACSAALYLDGEVCERFELQARQHSKLILPMMDALLADAGLTLKALDALAFGRGPGSFTGVRIAAGVIQGAAFAAGLPVVPVSSLRALAQGCMRSSGTRNALVIVDARMQEVYWGAYDADDTGRARVVLDDALSKPEQVSLPPDRDWTVCGSGIRVYEDRLETIAGQAVAPEEYNLIHAHDVATLAAADFSNGIAVDAVEALPVYLRDKVAEKPRAKPIGTK